MKPIQLAMLVSGSGTTAKHVYEACLSGGKLHGLVQPVCLIASAEGIGAIERLRNTGFEGRISICDPRKLGKNLGGALCQEMDDCEVDWFGQYGWLPMTPSIVIENFHGINQHPAPVPYFGGKGMYSRAPHAAVINFRDLVQRKVKTEATAQLVAPEYDEGGIIARISMDVLPEDTVDELQRRLLPLEWQTQVLALKRIALNGGNPPVPVESDFELLPGEEELLERAKEMARKQYPRG